MSDWNSDWEEAVANAIPVSELFEPRDIDHYLDEYSGEVADAWEWAPTGDMSEGQLDHFIDMLEYMAENFDAAEWEDFFEDERDFWEWFRDEY